MTQLIGSVHLSVGGSILVSGVDLRGSLFSVNLGPELAMFLSQAIYVLGSYEVDVVKPLM